MMTVCGENRKREKMRKRQSETWREEKQRKRKQREK
jgi:hypothetical protein